MSKETKKRRVKPKIVVLDYDDTIIGFGEGLCSLHNKKNGTSITANDISDWDFTSLEVKDASGNIVKGDELRKTFNDYEDEGLYVGLELLPYSYNALECIKEKGYKIFVVTARGEKFGKQTELNLIYNKIYRFIDDIIFMPEDYKEIESFKVKKIKELSKDYNIVAFADDKLETVQSVLENCNVNTSYLIEKGHNRECEVEEGIHKVRDIMEIVRFLKKVK